MSAFRPGKPRVCLGLSVDTVVGSGQVPVPWDLVRWSEGWNVATPATQLVVPKTGFYSVAASVHRGSSTANVAPALHLHKNGVAVARMIGYSGQTGSVGLVLPFMDELAAGDVLELRAVAAPTGGTGVLGLISRWSVVRLGPERWT